MAPMRPIAVRLLLITTCFPPVFHSCSSTTNHQHEQENSSTTQNNNDNNNGNRTTINRIYTNSIHLPVLNHLRGTPVDSDGWRALLLRAIGYITTPKFRSFIAVKASCCLAYRMQNFIVLNHGLPAADAGGLVL